MQEIRYQGRWFAQCIFARNVRTRPGYYETTTERKSLFSIRFVERAARLVIATLVSIHRLELSNGPRASEPKGRAIRVKRAIARARRERTKRINKGKIIKEHGQRRKTVVAPAGYGGPT